MATLELGSTPAAPPVTGATVEAWRRPQPTRQQQRADILVGLALAVLGVLGTELARGAYPEPVDLGLGGIEAYVLSSAVALPLCLRRRYPIPVMLAVAVLFVVNGERAGFAFGANLVTQSSMFMAIYAATAWSRDRRLMKASVVLVYIAMFGWLALNFIEALRANSIEGPNKALLSPYVSNVILALALNGVYFFGAYFWGRTAWGIARQRQELERQAVELAAQQQANARRAVIDERLRISRELHDVVAHHISSIGVQAGERAG